MRYCILAIAVVVSVSFKAATYAAHVNEGQTGGEASKSAKGLDCLCQRDWAAVWPRTDRPTDEALGKRTVECFRPESRDVFWQMDQVADPAGKLQPLAFDPRREVDRRAIYGRNTWILWCAGNEGFWDWLAQDAYGFLDLLKMLDSRNRGRRFRDFGLVNQPGMESSDRPGPWGLYLDTVTQKLGENLRPGTEAAYDAAYYPDKKTGCSQPHAGPRPDSDGVDPDVYGYPSGVVGLRLFPNPKFDDAAQKRWNAEAFYKDPEYGRDPAIVRPFRVGMSCGFCHVAAHPLNPPADPERPNWENLSSIIGNQYFRTSAIFGSRASRTNFIWHLLAAQQPGTIDASLLSTDSINSANTMNAVFEVPARIARAALNPPEQQSAIGKTLPLPFGEGRDMRETPRILFDGSDSVGAWGAMARVYLNIGTFYEEWNECHNPVIGFTKQRPFEIETCRSNSLYWQVNEAFRSCYLLDFFAWEKPDEPWQKTTAPMKLKNAVGLDEQQRPDSPAAAPAAAKGRVVYARHCMLCHSSKQPEGFRIDFAHQLGKTPWDQQAQGEKLVLPFEWENWESFKKSSAYRAYVDASLELSAKGDFLENNFLSTDLRIPISLVGSNAGRPLGTNALAGMVWADFSSETYKKLPAVGKISYYDPFRRAQDRFQPLGEGRGYCRPATLVSIWATAPLLHTNALGMYIGDDEAKRRVSVSGRLDMFDDAIQKLLWKEKRSRTPSGEGGLRDIGSQHWLVGDPGWIFRTDQESYFEIPRKHLRKLTQRTLPHWLVWFVDHPACLPGIGIVVVLLLAAASKSSRWLFYLCLLSGLLTIFVLAISGIHYYLPSWAWILPLAVLGAGLFAVAKKPAGVSRWLAATALVLLLLTFWAAGIFLKANVDGELGDLRVGPFPKGTPVNAVTNLDPDTSIWAQLAAVRGLLSATSKIRRLPPDAMYDDESLRIFEAEAGPALMNANKCPDFTLDRGHWFGESLTDDEKHDLITFLKTL